MLHLQLLVLIQLDEKNRLALIEFTERKRVAEQVTLERVAAKLRQEGTLLFRLDPFGDHR